MPHIQKAPYQIWAKSDFGPWRYKRQIHTHILFHSLSPFLHVPVTPKSKKYICMWGPGLAESDAVTFFAVPPVSWPPEDKTTRNFRNFLSWFQYFPSVINNSRESKMKLESVFGKFVNRGCEKIPTPRCKIFAAPLKFRTLFLAHPIQKEIIMKKKEI